MRLPSDPLDPLRRADYGTGRWKASERAGCFGQSPRHPNAGGLSQRGKASPGQEGQVAVDHAASALVNASRGQGRLLLRCGCHGGGS